MITKPLLWNRTRLVSYQNLWCTKTYWIGNLKLCYKPWKRPPPCCTLTLFSVTFVEEWEKRVLCERDWQTISNNRENIKHSKNSQTYLSLTCRGFQGSVLGPCFFLNINGITRASSFAAILWFLMILIYICLHPTIKLHKAKSNMNLKLLLTIGLGQTSCVLIVTKIVSLC